MSNELYVKNNTDLGKKDKFQIPFNINKSQQIGKIERLWEKLRISSTSLKAFLKNPKRVFKYYGLNSSIVDENSYIYNSYKVKLDEKAIEAVKEHDVKSFFKVAVANNMVPSSYYELIDGSDDSKAVAVVNIVLVIDYAAAITVAFVGTVVYGAENEEKFEMKSLSIDEGYGKIFSIANDMGGKEFVKELDNYIFGLYESIAKEKLSRLMPFKRSIGGYEV
ncbi:hypothetical protein [Liquorilactobacillus mali]|nr:hypothetical protein [Liquorilactobacillus mali]EJF00675.1 hypothetical protein LMA_02984 [Liquorilactobacillus mali KCTC 3596 = DSM 20444]MDC7954088.1 hypothetical protein [Liquorilactobacillus mali]QFQ75737.1 hypothetical protein LM596_11895 [Liquorilactobacillus mali]